VVAVKNSTGQLEEFVASILRVGDELRVFGLIPSDVTLGLLTHVGGDGVVGAGGVLGRVHPEFYNAVWAGEFDNARRFAAMEQRMMRDWYIPGYKGRWGHSTATVKAALNLRGLPGGYPRPPLLALSDVGVAAVSRTLIDLDLLGA
jgi:4-hydroxy-tetrahydrodipicolinate synthase